jgi:hypothetical protein
VYAAENADKDFAAPLFNLTNPPESRQTSGLAALTWPHDWPRPCARKALLCAVTSLASGPEFMPSPGKFCMVVETFVRGDLKFETRYFVNQIQHRGVVPEKSP